MSPESITHIGLRVTEDCNAGPACKDRCFSRQGAPLQEVSTDQLKLIIRSIKNTGATAINFMGGEPGLRPDLFELATLAKTIGLEVILTTNTLLFPESRLIQFAKVIDWLSISLDADNQRMNDALRMKGQFDSVMSTLRWISQTEPPFRVKVNTQVTAINKHDIQRIPESFLDKVNVWKLLQWTPRADAKAVMSTYAIERDEFMLIGANLRKTYPNLPIVCRPYPEHDPDAVIVRPNGAVQINDGLNDYTGIGNIHEISATVLRDVSSVYATLTTENYREFNESYPAR